MFSAPSVYRSSWLLVLVLSACGGGSESLEAPSPQTSATVAPAVSAPDPASIAPATTGPEDSPPTTIGLAALSPEAIYSLVAPSIPLIQTPTGTGSGILIEGGYVVTNYHVVWPYEQVRVVFPDGTEFADVPVLALDPFADLAVLGPVGGSAPSLSLVDGEGMNPGSDVYLIGYPAEADLFPQPTITSGVLSRIREWDLYALTLLQSDADIAGGQSGGALVNSSGDVVGISTWSFSDAGFSVATSAVDSAEIVQSLIGEYEQFGSPGPVYGDAISAFEFAVDLVNAWDIAIFYFEGTAGSTVEVAIDGASDGILAVIGPTGVVMEADDTLEGRESGIAELPVDGPYVVVVGNYAANPGEVSEFTLTSSVELAPFDDPDDGQSLLIGEPFGAVLDYHWDVDWYELLLDQGDTVVVWTEAIDTDTAVSIGYAGAGFEEYVWDDNSGPAVVGDSTNARLYYTAPISGTYHVVVDDVLGQGGGGYLVGVDRADSMEEPVAGESPGAPGSPPEDPDLPVDYGYDLRFDVNAGTTWRDLFDGFEPAEQDCIRRELGGLLEVVLASAVIGDDYPDQSAGILLCLKHDAAVEVYISVLVGAVAQQGVALELEDVACLREVFAGDDGAAFLAALLDDAEIEDEFGVLALLFVSCFPEEVFEDPVDPPDRPAALAEPADVPVGELVWQYRIPSDGGTFVGIRHVHPPVLGEGTLFLPASDGAVYALSASDGALLWAYRTHPRGTPHVPSSLNALNVVDGIVSVVTEELVHGIDAGTGETAWLYPGNFGSAPGVGQGVLFVQSALEMDAIDIESGSRLWSFNPFSLTRHAPVVDDGVVYFGADWEHVYAMDALTGELEWSHGIETTMQLSPVTADGLVYVALFDNTVYALDAATGRVIWQNRIPGRASDLLELVDGLLYLSIQALYALDAATGEIVWRFPAEDVGGPHLPVTHPWTQTEPYFTVHRGVVYYGSDLAEVFALDAATGRLLWEYQIPDGRPAAPTVSGDVVFLGSRSGILYALDAATGQLMWHYPTPIAVISSPLVADGLAYVTTADGQVHAVRAPS